jgi:Cu(I)/Ag(I) efflux system membrane protein CusA/SilA
MINRVIKFFLEHKPVTLLTALLLIVGGLITAPFNWSLPWLPRAPVAVDAIPDIGENQQIVFTEWMGRSPQDIEYQITYPLTSYLLGLPGVKTIRSTSMFGFSSIYVVFEDDVDFYWARSRLTEKLNALPPDLLPDDVRPRLGPDATALGQVFWYTLEAVDEHGNPAGGWDLHELRSIQDFYVRHALNSVPGVAEVASMGGHIREYQVDLDPAAMKAWNISLMEVMQTLRNTSRETGASTMEINQAEYYVRGLGYIRSAEDLEEAVVRTTGTTPVRIKDIAHVTQGPADRSMRGILDQDGRETVGGVVIARYGSNPMEVIRQVRKKIDEISPGLPRRELNDGTTARVTIVPFYDRSQLIDETLGTLNDAITLQILITVVVIIVMVYNLRTSLLISALLPFAVLVCFILMKYFAVDANIVALSGIAIAIGTMVDLGIIISENFLQHYRTAPPGEKLINIVYQSVSEVSSAILTAVATTIISFLPVFTLQDAEGKLFRPLAYTKTFALVSALVFTLLVMPAAIHLLFSGKSGHRKTKQVVNIGLLILGLAIAIGWLPWAGITIALFAVNNLLAYHFPHVYSPYHSHAAVVISVGVVTWLLSHYWLPMGADHSGLVNFLFTTFMVLIILGTFHAFSRLYPRLLRWCLENKTKFILLPLALILSGCMIWIGFSRFFSFAEGGARALGWDVGNSTVWQALHRTFPGLGKEFMPALDEGAFLLMPTAMPHAGVTFNQQMLEEMDRAVKNIPEVERVTGKAGRAETALDPAPLSMFENIIVYKPEYITDENGRKKRFKTDASGNFVRDAQGHLVEDPRGRYFRQWRDHIRTPDDIWKEIVQAARLPGLTSAPRLQPIETRLVMLQTGMRAPLGMKVYGPDLATIESFCDELVHHLKKVPSIKAEAVYADRALGKPYIEIQPDRLALSRYGLTINDLHEFLEVAVGGMTLTTAIEGRERYNIRARYARAWRESPEMLEQVLISTPTGNHIPLKEVAAVNYRSGPMMIRGEDAFPVGYVILDKQDGYAEVTVVEEAQRFLQSKIRNGELKVPPGVRFIFSGSYENQVRAEKRLAFIVPLSLFIIFLVLYLQFRSTLTSLFIFSGVALAFSGGFIMMWLYSQQWFMNLDIAGVNLRELFHMQTYHLSVAVWVGFIALFGIATDDGVVMGTYLTQRLREAQPQSIEAIRKAVMEAGLRRLRPCLMTTATTLLALLPVLSSSGRGADIMIPMAIPAFGGMTLALITLFVVPVLFAWKEERKLLIPKN